LTFIDGIDGQAPASQQGAIKVTKRKKHKGDLLLRFSSFCDFCGAFQKLNAEINDRNACLPVGKYSEISPGWQCHT
jgi:hypothetical protein